MVAKTLLTECKAVSRKIGCQEISLKIFKYQSVISYDLCSTM